MSPILTLASRGFLVSLAVWLLGACGEIDGLNGTAAMRPGEDCLLCHTAKGSAPFPTFTVAGTVFASADALPDAGLFQAEILVQDATGKKLTLRSNGVGNFYTAEPLQPPLQVGAQWGNVRMLMLEPPTSGACNSCHQIPGPLPPPGFAAPPGRIFVPTQGQR
jgi:hypothetical protein